VTLEYRGDDGAEIGRYGKVAPLARALDLAHQAGLSSLLDNDPRAGALPSFRPGSASGRRAAAKLTALVRLDGEEDLAPGPS